MKCSLCNEKIDDMVMPDKCKCVCLDCWDVVVLAMEIQLDPKEIEFKNGTATVYWRKQ